MVSIATTFLVSEREIERETFERDGFYIFGAVASQSITAKVKCVRSLIELQHSGLDCT